MNKKSRKNLGFGVLALLLLVGVVGIIGFAAWYVWHSTNVADTLYNAPTHEAASAKPDISIARGKLPKGWSASPSTSTHVGAFIGGEGGKSGGTCGMDVIEVADSKSNVGNTSYASQLEVQAQQTVYAAKGYLTTALPSSTITVDRKGAPIKLDAYSSKLAQADGSSPYYVKSAYLLLDGRYINLSETCDSSDLTTADQAISAVNINI